MPIYASYNSGLSADENARIGKIVTPLRAYIERMSDNLREAGGPLEWLFNVETSRRFAETIVGGNEFGEFEMVPEGGSAPNDSFDELWKKVIYHEQFMKGFHITRTMMEDSNWSVTAEMEGRAGKFISAYYRTLHSIAQRLLIDATNGTTRYNGMNFDLTANDKKPLFAADHTYGTEGDTQSNYFYAINANGPEANFLETVLAAGNAASMGMNDDNGVPMGYTFDTIILPANKVALTQGVKKAVGSESEANTSTNSINTQYGLWNVITLPQWKADRNEFMLMSKAANRDLMGNMFFKRSELEIIDRVDIPTFNLDFSSRFRIGAGFGNYRHISRVVISDSAVGGASELPMD